MSSGKWRPFCSGLNMLNMKWIVQFTPNNWIWFICPHASVQRVIIGLSHYRNRWWLVVNQILRNKLQWFFLYQNSQISVVLPSVQWVNWFKTLFTVALASCGDTASKINDIGLTLHWRHNDHGGVSNHQPHGCLLNRLFRQRSKKTSKLRVTGHCAGNSPGPVNSPHKGPLTRKMFPFDDVIMSICIIISLPSS